jgi:hypothetical protein
MPMYHSAATTAHRLKISKTHLLNLVRRGLIIPSPIKMTDNGKAPWLFSPSAKKRVDNKTRQAQNT